MYWYYTKVKMYTATRLQWTFLLSCNYKTPMIMNRNLILVLIGIFSCSYSYSQTQIITTGNNVINTSYPYAADIVIGSDANGGIRHDASIMWWNNESAARISNTADVFLFSVHNSSNPNIGLSAIVGGKSFIKGNLGIGNTDPRAKLHLVGNGSSINTVDGLSGDMVIQGNSPGRSSTIGAALEFAIPADTDGTNMWGQARIITVAGNTNTNNATGKLILGTRRKFDKHTGTGETWNYGDDIVIDGAGRVGIGTSSPDALLSVKGAIHTQEVKVDMNGWADHVFNPAYSLQSIEDVESFIHINQHLPDMPSEKEVIKNGIKLGEMNKVLVKKIEELTLYLIEQNKRIKQLENQINP